MNMFMQRRGAVGMGVAPSQNSPWWVGGQTQQTYEQGPWWGGLIALGANVTQSIWNTHTVSNSPYGINASYLQNGWPGQQTQQQGLTQAQIEALLRERGGGDELGSGSISSRGIRLGDTWISWGTIIIGGVVFMLIQSKPFGRK